MMWLLLGKSVHYILEKGAPDAGIAEEKFEMSMFGVTIVGVTDLYHNEWIDDHKVTSVFSFLLGDKPEWERQLNIYAVMYLQAGLPVKGLRVNAILRDWMKSKGLQDADYPPIPFMSVSIPLWEIEEAEGYIAERVMLHEKAEESFEAPMCTPEERWERPTTWAVYKKGNKRAARVLNSEEAAMNWIVVSGEDKVKYEVVLREGESIRCRDYCVVSKVCPFNPYKDTSHV
jgi:hypothetical protein